MKESAEIGKNGGANVPNATHHVLDVIYLAPNKLHLAPVAIYLAPNGTHQVLDKTYQVRELGAFFQENKSSDDNSPLIYI
jgi:hypothetical protein